MIHNGHKPLPKHSQSVGNIEGHRVPLRQPDNIPIHGPDHRLLPERLRKYFLAEDCEHEVDPATEQDKNDDIVKPKYVGGDHRPLFFDGNEQPCENEDHVHENSN